MSKEYFSGTVQEVADSYRDQYPYDHASTTAASGDESITLCNKPEFHDYACYVVVWKDKQGNTVAEEY